MCTKDLVHLAGIRKEEDSLRLYNAAASIRDGYHKAVTFSPKVGLSHAAGI